MRRPPEFIEVTEANKAELAQRMKCEPFIMNGLIYAAGDVPVHLDVTDTVAFPWPDAITALGQLAEEAEREEAGEPYPAWPIQRVRLRPGDMLIVKCGLPEGLPLAQVNDYLGRVKETMNSALAVAGIDQKVIPVLYTCDNVEFIVLSAAAGGSDG